MRAADIELLVELSRPALASDGSFAVVAASRPSISANRATGQLWRVEVPSGKRTRITRGESDSAPALTADDRHVLFLRKSGDAPQIFALPVAGGEAVQVTHVEHGVRGFRLSPDGSRLALQVSVPQQGRGSTVEGLTPQAQAPRHITSERYLGNGVGFVDDAFAHIFVQELDLEAILAEDPRLDHAPTPAGEPDKPADRDTAVQLTRGEQDWGLVGWSSRGILAVARLHENRDDDLLASLLAVDPDSPGAEPAEVLGIEHRLGIGDVLEHDGRLWLLASDLGESGKDFVAQSTSVYVVDGGTPRLLTDPDVHDFGDPGSHLTALGEGVAALRRTRGRVQLMHVTEAAASDLTDTDQELTGVAVAGGRIVAVGQSAVSFGELGVVADGAWTAVTDFGSQLAQAGIVHASEHEYPTRDGKLVHGWVWMPEGPGPHPVLLNIHGGPFAQYGVAVFDEAQVAVDAGYAVLQCNPRGSAGYGREHAVAIKEAMGTVDMDDVLDFVDGALAAHPALDGHRIGIMGGSYGGYLTAWTIAHEHRFTAAIVERGYLDPAAFIGTSDIGTFFSEEYTGYDPAHALTQSPMAVAHRVKTPTLIVHSELDFRCPLEAAQRYFVALRRAGVESELLVFPGEDHELTRSGQPRHRIERFEHVMGWWQRHMPA